MFHSIHYFKVGHSVTYSWEQSTLETTARAMPVCIIFHRSGWVCVIGNRTFRRIPMIGWLLFFGLLSDQSYSSAKNGKMLCPAGVTGAFWLNANSNSKHGGYLKLLWCSWMQRTTTRRNGAFSSMRWRGVLFTFSQVDPLQIQSLWVKEERCRLKGLRGCLEQVAEGDASQLRSLV